MRIGPLTTGVQEGLPLESVIGVVGYKCQGYCSHQQAVWCK